MVYVEITDEMIRRYKISKALKGKKVSEYQLKRIREAHEKLKGIKIPEERKIRIGNTLKKLYDSGKRHSNKGKKIHTEEHKIELSNKMKGNKFSMGRPPWNKGKKGTHFSPATEFKKGMPKELHNNWHGGISFEPYTLNWTDTLRQAIRERDHFICQLCKKSQSNIAFSVHHIDYNKKNCNPENLITLCNRCHMRTSFNRNKWIEYFHNQLNLQGG